MIVRLCGEARRGITGVDAEVGGAQFANSVVGGWECSVVVGEKLDDAGLLV